MKTDIVNIKDIKIDDIVKFLSQKSFVMAIPTDTVYALCCNACDEDAVKKIYDLKNREKDKPISLFIKSVDELNKYINCDITQKIKDILNKYWPGALTVIFKKKDKLFDYLTSNKDSIGIRIPDYKLLNDILDKIDFPLAQTSCNMSHEKELKNAKEIYEKFGDKIDLIIDSEQDIDNKASTIIAVDDDYIRVVREGSIHII